MIYSKELINEIHELYPNDKYMLQMAREGNYFLGTLLDNAIPVLSSRVILEANSLEKLKELILSIQRKKDLYRMWAREKNNFKK